MLKSIIIDDEKAARQILKDFLDRYCDVEVIAEADSVSSGVDLLRNAKADILFLDIEMQDGTGFDLLRKVDYSNLQVIFVTSHNDYAIEAFRFSALDYILKPIDPEDLMRAVEKYKTISPDHLIKDKLDLLLANQKQVEKIALPSLDGIHFIKLKEIVRVESDRNYTTFYLCDKSKLVISKNLKEFDTLLSPLGFYRVHKSH
ncbi:MAG: DNA-binding response regulator, partial [Marinilabiliales bacterium]